MPWTRFMDMHSGGGTKEAPYEYIYIEAPADEARVIFYNRFGHNPDRVTCTCCGNDYTVDESATLAEASAYERGCAFGYFRPDGTECPEAEGWTRGVGTTPGYRSGYVERPRDKLYGRTFLSVEDYIARDDVLVIRADEIDPAHRVGSVPAQGYVWVW